MSCEKSGLPPIAAMSGVTRLDEGSDDGAEGGADDDRDRKVDEVPAQDELLELLEHHLSLLSGSRTVART